MPLHSFSVSQTGSHTDVNRRIWSLMSCEHVPLLIIHLYHTSRFCSLPQLGSYQPPSWPWRLDWQYREQPEENKALLKVKESLSITQPRTAWQLVILSGVLREYRNRDDLNVSRTVSNTILLLQLQGKAPCALWWVYRWLSEQLAGRPELQTQFLETYEREDGDKLVKSKCAWLEVSVRDGGKQSSTPSRKELPYFQDWS